MMTGSYTQRIADSLLPLSVERTLPNAFEEWSFTGEVDDHEQATETCELCTKEDLRYQFRIRNALTGHALWVGSNCILRFGISVFENGIALEPRDAKKKLERLTKQMRLDSCIKALGQLAATEENSILTGALDYYKRHGVLTPKFAFVVFWKLSDHRIDHHRSFFKVCLRKESHRQALKDMPTERVHKFWAALSSSQQKLAKDMGHRAPPPVLKLSSLAKRTAS